MFIFRKRSADSRIGGHGHQQRGRGLQVARAGLELEDNDGERQEEAHQLRCNKMTGSLLIQDYIQHARTLSCHSPNP